MKYLFALLFFIPSICWAQAPKPDEGVAKSVNVAPRLHRIVAQSASELQSLFKYTSDALPFVSAHRGGPRPGYPENCLATFEHTISQTYAILEVDPRYTKDGQIVLYHDSKLGRTSKGEGLVAEKTLAELQQLKLKDSAGNLTEHTMPTLDAALEWARGRTILVLDQKDVPVAARVKKIEEHKAESYAMIITGNAKDIQECYKLNPRIMMEVMLGSRAKVAEFDKLGVPWSNVFAFVGHVPPKDAELYKMIHDRGALCMIGTSRNLDLRYIKNEVTELKPLKPEYRAFLKRGADLIETDIPVPLGSLLYGETSVPKEKEKFFEVK